jgi:hypothetical protein
LYIVGVQGDGAWYGWYAVFWKQQFALHIELQVVAHDVSQMVCLIGSLPGGRSFTARTLAVAPRGAGVRPLLLAK